MDQNKNVISTKTAFLRTTLLIILPLILMGLHNVEVEKIIKTGILWFLVVLFFFRVKKLEDTDVSGFDSGRVIWENDKGKTLLISYEDFHGDSTIRKISLKKISIKDDKIIYLHAFCFRRNENMCFRLDRLIELLDEDGKDIDKIHFLESLRVGLADKAEMEGFL